jgi:ABC-type Fe3+-hydroxamate transport system substrate-binding protein
MANRSHPSPPGATRATPRLSLALSLTAILVILAACGTTTPTATLPPATTAATPTAIATPVGTPVGTPAGTPVGTPGGAVNYPEMVKRAVAQLAKDKNIPEAQIAVVTYEYTEWPDSSLGCPKPGQAYLTVITPGYRVILSAAGQQYEYHTNEKNMVIRCPQANAHEVGHIPRLRRH